MKPSLAESSAVLAGCAEGRAVSKATPQGNNSSFKLCSTPQLHEGSLKGFMLFKEFNSPWLIFLSIMKFPFPPACFVLSTPGPAGEAPWPQGQGSAGLWECLCAAALQELLCLLPPALPIRCWGVLDGLHPAPVPPVRTASSSGCPF